MEKVLGIIAEYNPFHNGHLQHLIKSKSNANADYTIAVMGGNFTQRGEVSIINKWQKAEMALLNGIDLVLELPTVYSISSAENFAYGAVKTLNSLKIVDNISFGSETTDINALDRIAEVLTNEPKEYTNILTHELSKGISFPKARENAIMMYLNDVRRFANILSMPNNILGIEYLKALKRTKSSIRPICIPRVGPGHNELGVSKNIASGTTIRNMIVNGQIDSLEFKRLLPISTYSILIDNIKKGHIVKSINMFENQILYILRKMSPKEIADLPDVSEGLEYSIKNAANSCNSIVELLNIVNSKRYTKTRIQRILVYALLGITKKDIQISKDITPYIRVLGFNDKGRDLLSRISKANPKLQIVTSVKKFEESNKNKNLQLLLSKDIWASNVYTLGYEYDSWANLDYTQKLIVI
ncbi:MAG: nucleotidyltransferase [Clostridia bacterium]|nr:nucleotidyltransferase [Clostridia bacterium]